MTGPTWEQALDELEQHLHLCESLLRGDADEEPAAPARWRKPDGLGPLPSHLVDRAFSLRERQSAVIAAFAGAIAENRQQRNAAARAGRHTAEPPDSVYLDVTA